MNDNVKALIAEARKWSDAIGNPLERGRLEHADLIAAVNSFEAVLDALEAAQVPATDDEREALVEALNRVAFSGGGEELGTEERAVLLEDAVEAVFAAGFRRSSRVPVSRDELRAWAGMQVTGALANTTANGFLGVGALDAIYEQYDIFPKADRKPADEDIPGGCIYCLGSGVIEDYEGDRDCSGCDGTGTPRDRKPTDSSNGDDRG